MSLPNIRNRQKRVVNDVDIIPEPVDVLASFMIDEPPEPHRFRYHAPDGRVCMIKVDVITSIDKRTEFGGLAYTYRCQSDFGHGIEQYELEFNVRKIQWGLNRTVKRRAE